MKTHGLSNTKIYRIYLSMINRCYKKYDEFYSDYGGRGIRVCKEWLDDFMNFYNWAMANGYKNGLSIERKDVNGNYEPSNCTWITMPEQQRNKRNNVHISYNGKDVLLVDLAKEIGVYPSAITQRIKNGIDPTSPKHIRKKRVFRDDGVIYESISKAAELNNITPSKISMVCNGRRSRAAGHSFCFLTRPEAEQELAEMEGEEMKNKIKIHIDVTGQDTFARVVANSIRGLPSYLVVRLYDIYPILQTFPMFSKVRYFGIEKEFYCADGSNLLIARDTMSVDDWIQMLEKAKIEKESEEKSMLHNVAVSEDKVLEEYYVIRAIKEDYNNVKKVVGEMKCTNKPTLNEIAAFLKNSGGDFVSVAQNYRFENELPFC